MKSYVAALFLAYHVINSWCGGCVPVKNVGEIGSNIMMYKLYHCHIWMSLYTLSGIKSVFSVFISYDNPWASLINLAAYHQYLDFVFIVCSSFALTERCPVSTYTCTAINPTSYCSTFTAITDSDCFLQKYGLVADE